MKANLFNIISTDLATGEATVLKADVVPSNLDYEMFRARINAGYFETITCEIYEVEL